MKVLLLSSLFVLLIGNYDQTKAEFKQLKETCRKEYQAGSDKNQMIKKAGRRFLDEFTVKILPEWYTTPWTFTGHTEKPKQGSVACGYFVSTTLRDAGFNLNRYKLAQMAPLDEAKIIACGDSVKVYNNFDKAKFSAEMLKYEDGLYFVGLDFHVGFILKSSGQIYFIHSNYIGKAGVMKEDIQASKAIQSESYYVCSISGNKNLMKKWILNEKINY
ncbi:hypothetical protein NAT51_04900 [Flavobacterium amniphilum]|uniref:hypothetical protein n=1 Tax=Flavobacterium amniphilum TaxID=1834035 RepID=UPI00202A9628|nr:hypothetical protein [Flavobacterium amniphilum]MCL9804845.1 hypothetical protein [Flavobacterium amniphilum]